MIIREVQVKYKRHVIEPGTVRFDNSKTLYEVAKDLFLEPVEVFRIYLLNSKNKMIAFENLSRGSLATSVVHPREVFWTAVQHKAAAIICAHNHPSGDPQPSNEDNSCTQRIVLVGMIIGIRVLDHVIIGQDDYFSFGDFGLLEEYRRLARKLIVDSGMYGQGEI